MSALRTLSAYITTYSPDEKAVADAVALAEFVNHGPDTGTISVNRKLVFDLIVAAPVAIRASHPEAVANPIEPDPTDGISTPGVRK